TRDVRSRGRVRPNAAGNDAAGECRNIHGARVIHARTAEIALEGAAGGRREAVARVAKYDFRGATCVRDRRRRREDVGRACTPWAVAVDASDGDGQVATEGA